MFFKGVGASVYSCLDSKSSIYHSISRWTLDFNGDPAMYESYRHPKHKTAYRAQNWYEYEKSPRVRGDIAIWFSKDAIEVWIPQKNGKRGGQPVYSNTAIETSAVVKGRQDHLSA